MLHFFTVFCFIFVFFCFHPSHGPSFNHSSFFVLRYYACVPTTTTLISSFFPFFGNVAFSEYFVLLPFYVCMERLSVFCVCVFFPFILDIKFVGRTSRGHTGGRSHRIYHPPSFCGACLDPFGTIGLTTASFFLLDSPVLVALFCMGQPP